MFEAEISCITFYPLDSGLCAGQSCPLLGQLTAEMKQILNAQPANPTTYFKTVVWGPIWFGFDALPTIEQAGRLLLQLLFQGEQTVFSCYAEQIMDEN